MIKHRPYSIMPYDPNWVDQYNHHAAVVANIMAAVNPQIHHIGSTSIPDMVAKANIDIMVVVPDLSAIKQFYEPMTRAGYTPRGDYSHIDEEYFTEDQPDGERTASIHVFAEGNPSISNQLNFRNYLRVHPADRELYITTKQRLYAEHRDSYGSYDSGKKDVIEEIKQRANKWAGDQH